MLAVGGSRGHVPHGERRRRRCGRRSAPLERRVAIEHVLEVPPVRLTTVPGFDAAVFPYTTDIPFLQRLGRAAVVRSRIRSTSRTPPTSGVSIAEAERRRRPLRHARESASRGAHCKKICCLTTKTRRTRRRTKKTWGRRPARQALRQACSQERTAKRSALTTKTRRHEDARRRHLLGLRPAREKALSDGPRSWSKLSNDLP